MCDSLVGIFIDVAIQFIINRLTAVVNILHNKQDMKRNLLIVLRTCTRVNMVNDTGNGRYIKTTKQDLVNHCVSSLVDSINQVQGHEINLVVLDDHSTPESIVDINNILSKCKFSAEFIPVEDGTGNGHTMGRVYSMVEDRCTDLWYHVEDDYLHRPDAIQDMIDTVDTFDQLFNRMIAINPHDDIWRYKQDLYQSYLLLGPNRHYRTVHHTTYTCLGSRALYDKYRKHFQDVVTLTTQKADWVENKSINLVWQKEDVMLLSPIPGLGFHIMDESGRDPYVDIDQFWDSIPELWKNTDTTRFAVVSMYNDAHAELGAVTWPNKEAYAEKHGYGSYCRTDDFVSTPIHFEKLVIMLDIMNANTDLEWVWWLDNDAVITNDEIRLESIADPDYHVIISTDIASLNSGSFMVRNSMQGRGWLEFILAKGLEHYKDNRWPEQQPMTDFYVKFQDIVKIVPQRTMNSYNYKIYGVDPTDLLDTSGQWESGDFVLHMPAIPNPMRLDIIKQIL